MYLKLNYTEYTGKKAKTLCLYIFLDNFKSIYKVKNLKQFRLRRQRRPSTLIFDSKIIEKTKLYLNKQKLSFLIIFSYDHIRSCVLILFKISIQRHFVLKV